MIKGKETIAVLMGGNSSEREVSLKSGSAVLNALIKRGYNAVKLDPANGIEPILAGNFDKVFIALHGNLGEDGSFQGLLELLSIPYTGSGILASAATMDKVFAKKMMLSEGMETPEFITVTDIPTTGMEIELPFDYPVIVKPSSEGSTVGITRVDKPENLTETVREAFNYGSKIIVEKFIQGRELTVSVIDNQALPIIEIVPKTGFYDYEAKYTKGMTEYIVPAKISADMEEIISKMAMNTYDLFNCRGAARVDFILSDKGPTILEINTIPGMTETSLLPMAASNSGISFDYLVETIIKGASLDNFTLQKNDIKSALKGVA